MQDPPCEFQNFSKQHFYRTSAVVYFFRNIEDQDKFIPPEMVTINNRLFLFCLHNFIFDSRYIYMIIIRILRRKIMIRIGSNDPMIYLNDLMIYSNDLQLGSFAKTDPAT